MTEHPLTPVPVGTSVTVDVPATSANLGPGFDSFGLALAWRDTVRCTVTDVGFVADVTGEGASTVPRDSAHLVIATVLRGLADLGRSVPGLRVVTHNTIPHGRGLGSSAAAIVGGLLVAEALAGATAGPDWLLGLAAALEGHPDNVAAAIWGGFTMAYGTPAGVRVARGRLAEDLAAVVFVPEHPVSTETARVLLPGSVAHVDAAANSARAGLLVHALAHDLDLLPAATQDWLHTEYRRSVMPSSYALIRELREAGHAAVVSGAGPAVLVLGRSAALSRLGVERVSGFTGYPLDIGVAGTVRA